MPRSRPPNPSRLHSLRRRHHHHPPYPPYLDTSPPPRFSNSPTDLALLSILRKQKTVPPLSPPLPINDIDEGWCTVTHRRSKRTHLQGSRKPTWRESQHPRRAPVRSVSHFRVPPPVTSNATHVASAPFPRNFTAHPAPSLLPNSHQPSGCRPSYADVARSHTSAVLNQSTPISCSTPRPTIFNFHGRCYKCLSTSHQISEHLPPNCPLPRPLEVY